MIEREKLKGRIAALLAKTMANGCTEEEALSAAAKVAELLDRHALSMSDVEMRASPCVEAAFASARKKRMPLDVCVGAVAGFCDCRVWREKTADGSHRFVFFGLPEDAAAARDLLATIDGALRGELGRYKTSPAYLAFDHKARHVVNGSFALGMVESIADKLDVLKAARDGRHAGSGRDLALVKGSVVDEAFLKLGMVVTEGQGTRRLVTPGAYAAGEMAGREMKIG